MLKRSWQWQLVVIMMSVTALALGSFILVAWRSVLNSNYRQLDAELLSGSLKDGAPFLMRFRPDDLMRPPPPSAEPAAQRDADAAAFAFVDLERGVQQEGANWPSELDARQLAGDVLAAYARGGVKPDAPRPPRVPPEPPWTSGTRPPAGAPPPAGVPPPARPLPRLEHAVYLTVSDAATDWRLLGHSDGTHVFLAIRNLDVIHTQMAAFARAILLALPVALLLVGAVAWYLSGRALAPVRRLTRSAAGITADDLAHRLPLMDEPREFAQLIDVYNQMLDRLDRSFLQARRFSADAAHELNTPVTVLKGHLDLMLQAADAGSEAQQQLGSLIGETKRLQDIIQKLLYLSQADAGQLRIEQREINLAGMIDELLEDVRLIAPGLDISSQMPAGLIISGDPALLRQCVFNLLSNAIKYNREGGFVRVELQRIGGCVRLDVTNAGGRIPEAHAGRLFDRFYRADPARNTKVEGRGLGLALSREFARAHGGSVELVRNVDDRITFRLELPVQPGTA